MSSRLRHTLIQIALSILVIVLIPQFIYDPLKLRGFDDAYQLTESFKCADQDCSLMLLPAGEMRFGWRWSATINPDGTRLVPDNSPACSVKIAGVGDSFTWGPSVQDQETWLNRLAQHFPQACFYNYGQWGYNVEQIALTLDQRVPAEMDYVLYFIFQDDDQGNYEVHEAEAPPSPLIAVRYMQLIGWRLGWYKHSGWGEEGHRYPEDFAAKIRQMAADPRARVFVLFLDTYHVQLAASHQVTRPLMNLLNRVVGDEGLLHGVQAPGRGEALDRRDLAVPDVERQRHARGHRGAVEEHGARGARPAIAADLGPGVAEPIAEGLGERGPGFDLDAPVRPVHVEDELHRPLAADPRRRGAWSAVRLERERGDRDRGRRVGEELAPGRLEWPVLRACIRRVLVLQLRVRIPALVAAHGLAPGRGSHSSRGTGHTTPDAAASAR